jgi:hypothetical protein
MNARAGGAQRALAAVPVAVLLILIAVAAFGGKAEASGIWAKGASAKEAARFWTPARMRAAVPLEIDGPRDDASSASASTSTFGADFVPVPDSSAPEFRIHGAIFISLGIFGYGRCSGTAVRSPNESVVITAGHCINSGDGRDRWYGAHGVFVPGYRFGQRPFGIFPAHWVDAAKRWRTSGSENYDVGAMVVAPNEAGKTLGEAVGGAKIAWNLKPSQTFDVHGYPAEEPFDGETQRICSGTRFLGHDPNSFLFPGPLNVAVACELNGGASGGGWMIRGDTLNSVTDYGYFDEASPAFGAYFGKEVARLYGRATKVR